MDHQLTLEASTVRLRPSNPVAQSRDDPAQLDGTSTAWQAKTESTVDTSRPDRFGSQGSSRTAEFVAPTYPIAGAIREFASEVLGAR